MQRNHPDGEHQPNRDPAPALQNTQADSHARGDEHHTKERNPEDVPGDPAGEQRGDEADADEVIDAEDNHRDGNDGAAGDGERLWRGCRTGQQKRDAGERQRLKDHGAQAHVVGRSNVFREDVDECPEDVSDAERVSGHAPPALR